MIFCVHLQLSIPKASFVQLLNVKNSLGLYVVKENSTRERGTFLKDKARVKEGVQDMVSAIKIEIQIGAARQVILYPSNSKRTFYEPKPDAEPKRIQLGKLREGISILCVHDVTLRHLKTAELYTSKAQSILKDVLDDIQHLSKFNSSVNEIMSIIKEHQLMETFEVRMTNRSGLKVPIEDAVYWATSPDPADSDYRPHFPRDFSKVKNLIQVIDSLAKRNRLQRQLGPHLREIRPLTKRRKAKAETLVSLVRSALISLGQTRKKMLGQWSRRIRKTSPSKEDYSKPFLGLKRKDFQKYLPEILALQEWATNQIRGHVGYAKIIKIQTVEVTEKPDENGSPEKESGKIPTPSPMFRFHPITTSRKSALREAIRSALDHESQKTPPEVAIDIEFSFQPLSYWHGYGFPQQYVTKVRPSGKYIIKIESTEGTNITVERQTHNCVEGLISADRPGTVTVRADKNLETKTMSFPVNPVLLTAEKAHTGKLTCEKGRIVLAVHSASQYEWTPPTDDSYHLLSPGKLQGGPGSERHNLDLIPLQDKLALPLSFLVTKNRNFPIPESAFEMPRPKFDYRISSAELRKVDASLRPIFIAAHTAFMAFTFGRYKQCVDMSAQSIRSLQRFDIPQKRELAELLSLIEKKQIPSSERLALELCVRIQGVLKRISSPDRSRGANTSN